MIERGFVTAGSAPRVARIQALAFHDGAGQIRHMHHAITLEGAEPRGADEDVDLSQVASPLHNVVPLTGRGR